MSYKNFKVETDADGIALVTWDIPGRSMNVLDETSTNELEAIVKATTFYDDPDVVAKVSRGLGEAMVGINVEEIPQPHRLAERGW